MNIFAAACHDVCFFSSDFPRLFTTFQDLCSLSLAYRGLCSSCTFRSSGRPPLQGNQFPIRGADGHKGRALQMADTTHERPKVSPRAPHKAEGPSAVSASHTYHLCGSINSAALREKSYNQALVRKNRRFRVMRHNDFPLKTKPIKPFVPAPRA